MPTLNEERYVPDLIRDLNSQDFKSFEVILVDASPNNKTIVSAKKAAKDLVIKYIHLSSPNVSLQRNTGASISKGKYLIFIDADSRIKKNFTSQVNEAIKKYLFDMATPAIYLYSNHVLEKIAQLITNVTLFIRIAIHKPVIVGACLIISRSFFDKLGGFNLDLKYGEDTELIRRSYKMNFKVKFLRNIMCQFSLRRLNKENRIKVYGRYILTFFHELFLGPVKAINYKTGGDYYIN